MINTIPQDKLVHIANQTGNLVEVVNEGIIWADTFLSNENRAETKYDVKKYRRTLKKIKAVVDKKPAIALFGASQVGKSYMANNLLYNRDNKLMIYNHRGNDKGEHNFDWKLIDYLQNINPVGEQNEATGVVTRFTATSETDEKRLPVKIKVFSPMDIITIICDTYFQEFQEQDKKESPKEEKVQEHINTIKNCINKNSFQNVLTDDDVYEIKEYIEKHFSKKAENLLLDLKNIGYWDILADNISYINENDWAKVFSILWNFHVELDELVTANIKTLSSISFEKTVWIGFGGVVRSDKSIVDVATVKKFFDNEETIKVQTEDYSIKNIDAAKFSIVTLEVILSVDKGTVDNRPFINNIDIVDFPGARSRGGIHNLNNESLLMMLLRGKIAYLFNHYSSNYKTNTLSVCMRTAQTDTTTVPSLINSWIEDNLGITPTERATNVSSPPPPLFIIFTWWNTQLGFEATSGAPEPITRLTKQFETRFEEEIMGKGNAYNWNTNWIERSGQMQRFSNFYLLRDFARSKDFFKQNRDNNDQFLNEIDNDYFINDASQKYYDNYKNDFIKYHNKENKFFENPEEAFTEASTPNKDGSEYIIKNLIPVSSNKVSVPIYLNVLNDAVTKLNTELNKHYHSNDSEERLRKSAQDATTIQLKMDIVFGLEAYYFGSFIEHLTLTESEIVTFYHDLLVNRVMVEKKDTSAYVLIRSRNTDLDANKTFDENLTVLMNNYSFSSLEETKKHFQESENIDLKELFYGGKSNLKENSLVLAEAAREYWFDTKLNPDKFQLFIDKGLEKGMLIKLFDNLRVSYDKKVKMTNRVATQIRHFVDVEKRIDRAEDMVAHITAGLINEFVTSFGWSFYSDEDKTKLREAEKNSHLRLSIPNDQELFQALERINEPHNERMSVEYLLDYMNDLASNLNKIPIDTKAIEHVPMIKNYKRWSELMKLSFIANNDIPTYNIEANKKLGTILERIKEYHFAI